MIFGIIIISGCTQSKEVQEVVQPEPVAEEVETTQETVSETEEIPEVEKEEKTDAGLVSEPEGEIVEKDPNLIAHWKFDEAAQDSANNHHGIIKGGATVKEGKINKALYFDGVDDYVEFSEETVDKIGSLTQGTIALWFNFQSLLDKQTVMPILYIGGKERPDNIYVIEMGHPAGTEAPYDFNTPPGTPGPANTRLYSTWVKNDREPFLCFDSNRNLEENRWYHFAVVVSPSGNTGYLNGVEMSDRDYNFGNSKDPSFLNSIPVKEIFTLGYGRNSHMVSPNFVYYKGYLDDLRIYDFPLSSEEIKALSQSS